MPPNVFHRSLLLIAALFIQHAAASAQDTPSFRNDVMAVLSKSGCNLGTCHGNANGKGGLKLSLRGQTPETDYLTLTRETGARRITLLDPEASLLLQKPLMQIPHEGGRRFERGSAAHKILRDWIAGGLPQEDSTTPSLISLNVSPPNATVSAPETSASLKVTATFDDGSTRDVTALAVYDPSMTSVTVSATGTVTAEQPVCATVVVRYLNQQVPVRLDFIPDRPDFIFQAPPIVNFIDEAVFAQLQPLKINPAPICDDTTFLRRAYLDLTGLLPPIEKARTFATSTLPDKRAILVAELLTSEEFNDFQTLRWADLLRVEEKTLDSKGVDVFHAWIRDSMAQKKPLNEFAAEIIAAHGSTYKVPPTNFYRALRKPEARAEAVAQVFLGIRLQCARCHNHPFDHWTQDDYYGWSNFFARIDYEIIENKRRDKNDKNEFLGEQIVKFTDKGEVKNPTTGKSIALRFLADAGTQGYEPPTDDKDNDRLQQLAAWLSDPSNQRFATTQANRIWAQLIGTGIIDPVDDSRSTNPPSNSALLNSLQQEFVANNFDIRQLMQTIMNSSTYQLASSANTTSQHDDSNFARTIPHRMTAEQTLDAIGHVLDIPVKFGGHDPGTKAVQLKGVRNGEFRYSEPEVGDRFLALFGKPNRLQTCECERANETTLAQTFEMVSGELVSTLLQQPNSRIDKCLAAKLPNSKIIEQLYLAALSRTPTVAEQNFAADFINKHDNTRAALEDIVWALLNANEFLLHR